MTDGKSNISKPYKKAFKELQHHLDNTSLALVQFNERLDITEWSARAAEISGYDRKEVIGKGAEWIRFSEDGDRQKAKKSIFALIGGEKERDTIEIHIDDLKGEPHFLRIHSSALRNDDGQLISILTLIEDLTERQKAQKKIRRSSELFEKLFTNAPQAIAMVHADFCLKRVNNSFETVFDYTANETIGRNVNKLLLPDKVQKKRNGKNIVQLDQDHILLDRKRYTKSGEPLDVIIGSIPVYLDGEIIAGFGIYIDVTERKKSERQLKKSLEEKQVLIEEVHHRVKNNLAVVSGLLQMQTLHVDDPRLTKYIQNSQLRIQSMAIVHEMLYQSNRLSQIQMHEYVQRLSKIISDTLSPEGKTIEIQVHSDEIILNVNQAIPCALIISELITNAFEFAFEGRDEGKIAVNVSDQQEMVRVSVQDDGIGLPDNFEEMRQKSLGITLMENLCAQLETDIEIESGDWGTRFAFRFEQKNTRGSSSSNPVD